MRPFSWTLSIVVACQLASVAAKADDQIPLPRQLPVHTQTCEGRSYTFPSNYQVVCSRTWNLHATCTGADLWDKWQVAGSKEDSPFIHPWTDVPIMVVGYELLKVMGPVVAETRKKNAWSDFLVWLGLRSRRQSATDQNRTTSFFGIGSGIVPDMMVYMGPGENHVRQMWAAGLGQPWPSIRDKDQGGHNDIIDVHGACWGGGPIEMVVTVYYTPIEFPMSSE